MAQEFHSQLNCDTFAEPIDKHSNTLKNAQNTMSTCTFLEKKIT